MQLLISVMHVLSDSLSTDKKRVKPVAKTAFFARMLQPAQPATTGPILIRKRHVPTVARGANSVTVVRPVQSVKQDSGLTPPAPCVM